MFGETDRYVCLGCCWAIKRVSAWHLNVFWTGHLFAHTTVVVLLLDYCYYFISLSTIYYCVFPTLHCSVLLLDSGQLYWICLLANVCPLR